MQTLRSCPICESQRIRFDYRARTTRRQIDRRSWSIWSCENCEHGFINPQPSWLELEPYYSSEYAPYEASHVHGEPADDETYAARARASGKLRHIPIPTGLRVLDVGCGGGYFLRIARLLGADTQGIEPSPHGAQRARVAGLKVFNGTIQQYVDSPEVGAFDVITANHVLEHTPNPVDTLRMMRKLLNPGGHIWISVPNAGYPLAIKLHGRWHSTDLPYHLMQFTPRSLRVAADRAKLNMRSLITESIPDITAGTIRQYLRHKWILPIRVSAHIKWIDRHWAPRYARKMDQQTSGEALLTELVPA